MKIIDAYWEKRNLGVSSTEIIIEPKDKLDVLDEITQLLLSTAYITVKIPPTRIDFISEFSQKGFLFIETQINIEKDLKKIDLSEPYNRFNAEITYAQMDEQDFEHFLHELELDIFDTDRIALDTHFSKGISAKRYANWMRDEFSRGTELYNIIYERDKIGFFSMQKKSDKIYSLPLGGLYKPYKASGFGFAIVQKPLEIAYSRGAKKVVTSNSSNNLWSLKCHLLCGFSISSLSYVFIKHNS